VVAVAQDPVQPGERRSVSIDNAARTHETGPNPSGVEGWRN
jgi:hypothetical protein